jgi:hypothetical protein
MDGAEASVARADRISGTPMMAKIAARIIRIRNRSSLGFRTHPDARADPTADPMADAHGGP